MILCCGEALIDMIPRPTVDGPDGFVPHSGGAVFNTAIALGRLGARVGMLSGVSSDMFGDQLCAALVASDVACDTLIISDRPTTLAFVKLTDGHATYSFFDEQSAGRMITPADLPALPEGVSTAYFGGISLACEPGAEAYEALCLRESDRRVIVMDPNIRPGFITDEPRYRARLDRMLAACDIVKVSDEDLDWILPGNAALRDKAHALRAKGPGVVIVTRGSQGALGLLPGGDMVEVPVQKVTVVDTVGAGDTFNAGVLAALDGAGVLSKDKIKTLTADQLQAAIALGAQVAAITVSRAGANPPWRSELA